MDTDTFASISFDTDERTARQIRDWNKNHLPQGVEPAGNNVRFDLRLSRIPRTDNGLVFGSHKSCDIRLPSSKTRSLYHFAITFDEQNRMVIRDLRSVHGLEVQYDGQGQGRRREFTWIIHGAAFLKNVRQISIRVHEDLVISIKPKRSFDPSLQATKSQIKRFRPGQRLTFKYFPKSLFGTDYATKTIALAVAPIHLQRFLGQGTFGAVVWHWNVSDGSEFAIKKPANNWAISHDDLETWRREFTLLKQYPHENIVKLLKFHIEFADDGYIPVAQLEYCGGGSLDNHKTLTRAEIRSILQQCLSGLVHLHQNNITHRDIKPANILVRRRDSDGIQVVLGDFGLAKEATEHWTFVGTPRYFAPELEKLETSKQSYTSAVDIWALGATIFDIAYHLDNTATGPWSHWFHYQAALEAGHNSEDPLISLLRDMLD